MTETRGDYQIPARLPEPMSEERLSTMERFAGLRLWLTERERADLQYIKELLAEVRRLQTKEPLADSLAAVVSRELSSLREMGYVSYRELQAALDNYKEGQQS